MKIMSTTTKPTTEKGNEINWIEYSELKPSIGQLVACYRDIESKQIFITEWSKEDEGYAEMNRITHWFVLNYPINKE